jgi:hypothetical protein
LGLLFAPLFLPLKKAPFPATVSPFFFYAHAHNPFCQAQKKITNKKRKGDMVWVLPHFFSGGAKSAEL